MNLKSFVFDELHNIIAFTKSSITYEEIIFFYGLKGVSVQEFVKVVTELKSNIGLSPDIRTIKCSCCGKTVKVDYNFHKKLCCLCYENFENEHLKKSTLFWKDTPENF